MNINEADWKSEKHVPVIEVEKKGEMLEVKISVGKEIPHPNLPDHHISWIEAFFVDERGNAFPIGRADFEGHGEAGFTEPVAFFAFKPTKKGKIVALSFCNIHGLWKSEKAIE